MKANTSANSVQSKLGALRTSVFNKTVGRLMRRIGLHMQADYSQDTMFGHAFVYTIEGFSDKFGEGEKPVRVLDVDGSYQSATYLDDDMVYDLVFAYDTYYDLAFELNPQANNVCMIGGGGYAYPKHFIATYPEKRIDVIEVDPAIEQIAHRFFFLDRLIEEFETESTGKLELICADGLAYLKEYARSLQELQTAEDQNPKPYDIIMNDAFKSLEPSQDLATVDAVELYRSCLTPEGLYLSNVVATLEGKDSEFLYTAVNNLKQVFSQVKIVPCYDPTATTHNPLTPNNHMLIASDIAYDIPYALELY